MLDMVRLAAMAAEAGFTHSAPLDVSTLELRDEVRAMCSANTCRAYGRNWSCPPACGELEELRQRFAQYSRGILVQTVGEVEDSMDYEGMMEAEAAHKEHFAALHEKLLETWPGLLALGAGTCTRCRECTYPDAPCRFPTRAHHSMEACGIDVGALARLCGIKYNNGPLTVTYFSMLVFS
jgi:predicted metal-binding protein